MWQLKKLTLHNFRKLGDFELLYTKGFTGVLGRNGQGKTTLADLAQTFMFTGEFPDDIQKKDRVTWGAEEGWGILEFDYENRGYILTRHLHDSKDTLFCVADEEIIAHNRTEVNERMQGMLGVSYEAFRTSCFVPQGELFSMVNTTPANMLKFLQEVFGLKMLEMLRSDIQEATNKLPALACRSDDIIAKQEEIVNLKQIKDDAEKQLEKQKEYLINQQSLFEEAQEAGQFLSESDFNVKTQKLSNDIDYKNNELQSLAERKENCNSALLPEPTKEQATQYNQWLQYTKDLDKKEALDAEITKAQESLSFSQNSLEELPEDEDVVILELQQRKLKEGICPVCKSREDNLDEKSVLAAYNTCAANKKKRETLQTNIYKLQALIEAKRDELARFELVEVIKPDDSIIEAINNNVFEKNDNIRNQLDLIEKEMFEKNTEINSLQTLLDNLETTGYCSDQQKVKFRQIIEDYQQVQVNEKTLEEKIILYQSNIDEEEKRLQNYQNEEEKYQRLSGYRNLLTEFRDLLHRKKLPAVWISKYLAVLNRKINDYLSDFDVDFSADIDSAGYIKVKFSNQDKPKIAKSSLSGGQKVILALAIRFAIPELLGNNFPLIVIDEPTAFLDEQNKAALTSLFSKIRTNMESDKYVFINTHEKEMASVCTEVIEL